MAELKRRWAQQAKDQARKEARRERAAAKAAGRLHKHRSEETVHGGSMSNGVEQLQADGLAAVGEKAAQQGERAEQHSDGNQPKLYLSFFGWHKGSQQHRRSSQLKAMGSSASI